MWTRISYFSRETLVSLRRNLLIYGVGGVLAPFLGIKLIDIVVTAVHLA